MQIFITGTDTDAGKTYVTALILEALNASGQRAVGFKPFCCGSRADVAALQEAGAEGFTMDELNPVWLKTPASPYTAALIENRKLDFDAIKESIAQLSPSVNHLLLEGAGGWEVPLTETTTTADFAQELGWPVLVVVNNRLGALNHTLLTVKNIQARGLTCLGVILNYVADARDAASISNRMVLENMGVNVLGEVMHGETDGSELRDMIFG